MGCTIYSNLYYGVTASVIAEVKEEETVYELHDARTGEKNGKTETETKSTLKLMGKDPIAFQGEYLMSSMEYDIPYTQNGFCFVGPDNMSGDNTDLDDIFIGVNIAETPYDQPAIVSLGQQEVTDKLNMIKHMFKKEFGYEGELELTLQQVYSC